MNTLHCFHCKIEKQLSIISLWKPWSYQDQLGGMALRKGDGGRVIDFQRRKQKVILPLFLNQRKAQDVLKSVWYYVAMEATFLSLPLCFEKHRPALMWNEDFLGTFRQGFFFWNRHKNHFVFLCGGRESGTMVMLTRCMAVGNER